MSTSICCNEPLVTMGCETGQCFIFQLSEKGQRKHNTYFPLRLPVHVLHVPPLINFLLSLLQNIDAFQHHTEGVKAETFGLVL